MEALTVIPAERRADYVVALDTADAGDPEMFRWLIVACMSVCWICA